MVRPETSREATHRVGQFLASQSMKLLWVSEGLAPGFRSKRHRAGVFGVRAELGHAGRSAAPLLAGLADSSRLVHVRAASIPSRALR